MRASREAKEANKVGLGSKDMFLFENTLRYIGIMMAFSGLFEPLQQEDLQSKIS